MARARSSTAAGAPTLARIEKSRAVTVVETARRAEYPAIAAGGAGWSRASRRPAAYGRDSDHTRQWLTTCAVEQGLDLAKGTLDATRRCLARVGNLSSVSVLILLHELLAEPPPPSGSHGLLFAMGPGFCAELVSIGW